MGKDKDWPFFCTLMGCTDPFLRPHHHHIIGGHLSVFHCTCGDIAEPGTRPRETE